ncbi:hypothetical protein Poly51_05110 [Rubripirellula tenax]|uniref:Uncharacterized protein n=1 Tax=Rubripirellula tenax TaxID=2528015 RepID=A0A5C6FEK0_9BACT|nr:hypothetical protein [Rubripirellula tenax]TWU60236.1 hypothetical protein Poly51_05110 [Rubripirellula tenax]
MTNQLDGQTRSRSRLFKMLLFAVPVLAIIGGWSWWLQAKYPSAGPIEYQPAGPPPEYAKYMPGLQPPSEAFASAEMMRILDRLSADCVDILADVDRTEARVRAADPHLDQALADPYTTPFIGPNAFTYSDLLRGCKPMTDAMIGELAADRSSSNRVPPHVTEALDRILFATVSRSEYDSEDFVVLQEARDSGVNDPLVLACLLRNLPENDDSFHEVARALFAHRKDRTMSIPTTAFVYHSFRLTRGSVEPIEYAEAVSEYSPFAVRLWEWIETTKPEYPIVSFQFTETYNLLSATNSPAAVDLLIELDRCQNPAVAPELRHLLVSLILTNIAATYRGTKYINETDPERLDQFGDFAKRSADHLLKAWSIEPRHTILPAKLGALQYWSGTTPRSDDEWFRHSLATAVDNKLAWETSRSAMKTKWGGSPEKQLWFAEMCVGGEKMIGSVFFKYSDALYTRIHEAACTERLGQNARIRKVAKTVVDRLQAFSMADAHPEVRESSLPPIVATLWQAGDFDDLNWLLSVYGDRISSNAMHFFNAHTEEIKQFSIQVVQSEREDSWLDIHDALHATYEPLDDARLGRLDMAIEEARQEVTENSELSKSLARYQRRSSRLRTLNDGEEIVLTEQDLRDCFEIGYYAEFNYGTTLPSANADASEPSNEVADDSSPSDSIPSDVSAEAVETIASGFVEFQVSATVRQAVLLIPLALDPPLRLSAVIELIPVEKGLVGDPYGVSLLVGATSGAAYATDKRGPILTVQPGFRRFMQDELPEVTWEEGKGNFRLLTRAKPSIRSELRIDAFPDGYRTFIDGKQFTEVSVPLQTDHLVQIGRYSNARRSPVSQEIVKYRMSDVRLKKLDETSVDIQPN